MARLGTQEQLETLVDLVADMVALRLRPAQIRANLAEINGGVEPTRANIETLTAKARARLLERLGVDKRQAQADAVGLYESVLRDPNSTWGDRMRAQGELNAIFGLADGRALVVVEDRRPGFSGPRDSDLGLLDWALKFLPHLFHLEPSDLHRWLASEMDALRAVRGQRLDVIGPRGSSKSTVGSTASILNDICESREPYIVLISDTATQAQGTLDGIKDELETNDALAAAYPHAVGKGPVWRDSKIVTANNVTVEALGTGCKLRGRRVGANRPSKIVIDDAENDDHITSPHRRAKVANWFDRAVMKAGSPTTNVVVLGSSLCRGCLVENLALRPGWRSKRWPSILTWPDRMDLWAEWEAVLHAKPGDEGLEAARQYYEARAAEMEAGAEVLWPEREPLYALMLQRAIEGHRSFEAEKQSRPVNPESVEWPEEYLDDRVWVEEWPTDPQHRVLALDPSKGKDARRGDFQARVRLEVGQDGLIYIGAHMGREDVEVMSEGLVEESHQVKPDVVVLETNAWQDLLAGPILDAAKRVGCHVPLCGLNNDVKKEVRIRRWTSWLAQRRVRFVSTSPGTRIMHAQFVDFPNGDHDDGPDAAEMALRAALALDEQEGGAELVYFTQES